MLADFVGTKATKTNAELATAGARIGEVTAVVLAPVGQGASYAAVSYTHLTLPTIYSV